MARTARECADEGRHYTPRVLSRRVRLWLSLVALLQCSLLFGLAWTRFVHVHQRTFDLALYARVAWGFAHGDLWSPVLNTHALAAHVAPVLVPLGLLGRVFGVVPVLLFAQALCIALCVFPLARIGARRLGTRGIWLASAAWLLYPNLFHVGTYEFHPGTLAVLPMCWAYDALDRAQLRAFVWSVVAILLCREDLGAFAVLLALVYYGERRDRRALVVAAGVLVYTGAALAVTLAYAPDAGSLDQHFGPWGGSPFGVLGALLHEPERVLAHFSARERLLYLARVLAPLSFFSLRAPRLLLPGLPYLALNLLSVFPTAQGQYSHYLTPAVPALLVSGVVGVTAVRARFLRGLWFVTLGIAHHALGGSPLARDFERGAFVPDAATRAAQHVLARIPADASVQAPDPLLPHLSERHELRRAPPPEAATQYVAVDVSHRQRYARREDLLRTTEEPLVRKLLARPDHALLVYEPPYALFERGRPAREGIGKDCLLPAASGALEAPHSSDHAPQALASAPALLTDCLALERAELAGLELALTLRATGPCASDLALRFGPDPTPGRVELLCDGTLSPASLRAGDRVRSRHQVSARGRDELRKRGLWLGVLRQNGEPPASTDPIALRVPLQIVSR